MGSDDGRAAAPIARRPAGRQVVYSSHQTLVLDETAPFERGAGPTVPLSIFATRLSGLQAIVRYLHDWQHLSFSEIAALLGRSPKTVWTSYGQAKGEEFSFEQGGLEVPLERFARRDLSVLETLVAYLVGLGFSNAESARLLALDPRTTWTVRKRIEKKGVGI